VSDYMEMTENYKKIWEQNLADKVSELERLKVENARLREALQIYANDDVIGTVARKALKGGE